MIAAAMAPPKPQSGEMLTLLERHKIQVLLDAEFSAADVAKRTGISLDTVRRVQRETAVTHTDDKLEHRQRRIGRRSLAAQDRVLRARRRSSATAWCAHRSLRGLARGVLAARLRARRCPVRRCHEEARALLCLTAQILALRCSHAGRQRACRDDHPLPRSRLRSVWWVAIDGGFRPTQDHREQGRQRARRRDIQCHVRPGDRGYRRGHRDVCAAQRQSEGLGRASGGLGQRLVLQASQVP
jgi:hypothetical protein